MKIRLLFILILLTTLSFIEFPQTFFQQDEWQFFGANISALATTHPLINTVLPYGGQLTHFYPFMKLLFLLEYILFNVNFAPYALLDVVLHFFNSILVYFLIKKITKQEGIAILTTIFFLVNSISHQALTWVLAGADTLPATFFLLLSLVYFIDYSEKNKRKDFLISLIFFVISLLFKEISIFLFILFPLYWLISKLIDKNQLKLTSIKQPALLLFITGGFYLLLRIIFLFSGLRSEQPEVGDVSVATFGSYIYRLISLPLKGLSQSIFPQKILIGISDSLTKVAYPQFINIDKMPDPKISQSIGLDLVCFILAVVIFGALFLLLRYLFKNREIVLAKALFFVILLVLTSFVPFVFIPGRAGYFSIFEPRNLYISGIGTSLLIVLFFYILGSKLKKQKRIFLTIILLLPILFFHIMTIRQDIKNLKEIGLIRRSFLTTIQTNYPKLSDKVVVYTQSDRPYYGMPEDVKILPVQSGFGRMVMIWYQNSEKFPSCLYENQFLHDLLSQGYKECDHRGFGYVRDYGNLIKEVRLHNIANDSIIAYSWNGQKEEFDNITQEVRKKVQQEIKNSE